MEIKATSLSQEELKSKAVMFCEDFGEVDKKTISKLLRTLKKSTIELLQMSQIQFLNKWVDKKAKCEVEEMFRQRLTFRRTKIC